MLTLRITGMTCGNCVKHVTHALEAVPGVEGVEVSLERGEAQVQGHPDPERLVAAVLEEGYAAEPA